VTPLNGIKYIEAPYTGKPVALAPEPEKFNPAIPTRTVLVELTDDRSATILNGTPTLAGIFTPLTGIH
jgi:hypothetical protein